MQDHLTDYLIELPFFLDKLSLAYLPHLFFKNPNLCFL